MLALDAVHDAVEPLLSCVPPPMDAVVSFALIVIICCYNCKKRSRARPVVRNACRNAYTPSTSSTSSSRPRHALYSRFIGYTR